MHSPQRPTKPVLTPPPVPRPEGVQLRARRSPKLIALGVLLVALGGLGAAALYASNVDHRSVVVMAQDVDRGQLISAADLAVVDIPASLPVDSLPATEFDSLVGKEARTDLPAGAFPRSRSVGPDPLPEGISVVGLRLPLGKLPTADLPVGTKVRVVGLGEGTESSFPAVTSSAPTALGDGQSFVLQVQVADADTDAIARLAAADLVALVVVGV